MTDLIKGGNQALGAAADAGPVRVELGWTTAGPGYDLDLLTVLLGADGQVSGPGDVVYYKAAAHSSGAVRLAGDATGQQTTATENVTVDLKALPAGVSKIVFVVDVHAGAARGQSFANLQAAHIRVLDAAGAQVCRFDLSERGAERTMVFGELYLHTSGWKFRAVGQGFADGLVGLANQYGAALSSLDLTKAAAAPPPPPPPPAAPPAPVAPPVAPPPPAAAPPAPPAPAAPAPGGSKVVLTKSAPTVSLTKRDSPGGEVRINLNWTSRPPGTPAPSTGGFFSRRQADNGAIDLDLGCLYEFSDGTLGVVQALGNAFHAPRTGVPVIRLDGDDRSGAQSGGENLYVDLSRPGIIKRILVFALIYQGVPNWAGANAVATLYPVGSPPVEIALDDHEPGSPTCAIALLENVNGEIQVRREVRYIRGLQDVLDQTYGWGMQWTPGSK